METSSVLLVCVLVTCSVWTVHGRSFKVNINDEEQTDMEVSVEAGKLPGVCWACKWALNKVKKSVSQNATVEKMKSKLLSVCDQIGLLKSLCRKFVKSNLAVLVEELTTTDDVRTICVNTRACKPKELLDLIPYSGDEDTQVEINVYPRRLMHG
ncbi:NK-lysin tandem duplicate 4 [Thunnus thynnus]|uniref:antimicrobial peptide NK-lysin-like n=1 Tax=Thunnus maccoyii TaxID=8240 RepID=UPI001C4CBC0D|nr:antimicrobial peptide NK-lysin-like [Thunnus maccoyii]|eukprot:superscaffoldBa00004541_g19060